MVLYGDSPAAARRDAAAADRRRRPKASAAGVLMSAMMDDPTGYGRVIRDAHGRRPRRRGTEGRHTGAARHPRSQHGDLLLPRRSVLEARRRDPAQQSGARILPHRHGGDPRPRRTHAWRRCRSTTPREALGINNRAELAEVDAIFRERKARELMLAGVTIEKPETVTIDSDVEIGMDTIVEPFAQILGKTTIGENCRIGACSIVQDSELADEVEIGPFTIVNTSTLERGAHAGPVRAAAHGESRRGRRAHRQLRGVEEDAHGRRAPRRATWRTWAIRRSAPRSTSARARSPAITTATRSTRRRSARARSSAATRRWWRRSKSARARMWRPGR